MSKTTISEPQRRLLALLRSGWAIIEDRGRDRHRLRYTVAQISPQHPCALHLPRPVHKETVFALLACGLLGTRKPWDGYEMEVMELVEDVPLFYEVQPGRGGEQA